MLSNIVRNRILFIVCLIVAVSLIVAQAAARSSGSSSGRIGAVQGQPNEATVHLEAAFAGNTLIGTLTVYDKEGRPWRDVRGQADLLDASGNRLTFVPLQPLGPGEFRLIVPLGRLDAPGYLDVRLPGHGQASEQRAVYEINPASRTVAWTTTLPGQQGILSVQATGGPDAFGYTWDDTAAYAWIDTSTGISVTLRDDDDVGPLQIGFTFNFYGKAYAQFYIDSNGYLSFADNTQSYYNYSKYSLPVPARPNNLIAPFWEDFDPSRGGTIRYQTFGAYPNRYLVVEWNSVPSWVSPGQTLTPQSFQAILYEGSNQIRFQYSNTRTGTRGDLRYATVGIENDDGTIGLAYPDTIPVGATRAVLFSFTQPPYNVFLTPDRQGGTAAPGSSAAFHVLVKNLGTQTDAYTLSRPAFTGSDWTVSFYESNGTTPLAGNSTGSIATGSQKDIVVKVSVPSGASTGDWTRVTVQATSQGNGSVQSTTKIDTLFAPSFYQVYTDNYSGDSTEDSENYVAPIVNGSEHTQRLTTDQDNSGWVGTANTPDGKAVAVSDVSYQNNNKVSVTEVNYCVVDRNGSFVRSITRLTDNSAATQATFDFSPAAAVAPGGHLLIGWGRQPGTYNIRYAVMDSSGGMIKAPTALTNNTGSYPRAYPPSVVALAGGNFLATWEQAEQSGGPVNIYYTVLDGNGNPLKGATSLTSGGTNVTPRAAAFSNGKVAIVWTSYNSYGNGEIYYAVLNGDGSSPSALTPITNNGNSAESIYADAAALSDGQLAVAWTQIVNDLQIQYTIVTGSPPMPGQSPQAGFTSSSPDTLGETTIFANTTTGTEPISYQWAFGDGATSTDKDPTHLYAAAGTYTVWLTATNSYGVNATNGTVQITSPSGWTTIVSEDFEGTFPGTTWQVIDNNGTTNGEYYWAKKNCKSYEGSYSGWAVGGGANGAALSCGANYPNYARSWMMYGPFSLADATAADLRFKLWLNSELGFDRLCRLASINGTNFSGSCISGNTSGAWVDQVLDLSNVYSLGNLLGQPSVWIALIFDSDVSNTYPEGAYVDNIVLRKCTSASCPGASNAAPTDNNGQGLEFTTQYRATGERRTPTDVGVQRPTAPQTIYTVPNEISDSNIYVSLTVDDQDRLMMTWLDSANGYYLYYAQSNHTGSNLTPATILQRTRHSYLWSSWNGYGNTFMPAYVPPPVIVYLPVALKNYPTSPPQVVKNGGLEEKPDFNGWTSGGDAGLSPMVVTSQQHSGDYAAVLGQEGAPCRNEQGGKAGQSWIYQNITVPSSGGVLTFYYRIFTYDKLSGDKYDRFEVYVNGTLLDRFGNTDPWSYNSDDPRCSHPVQDLGWRQFTYDLGAYRGQDIQLQLVNITYPDDWFGTWTYVDDVSVN